MSIFNNFLSDQDLHDKITELATRSQAAGQFKKALADYMNGKDSGLIVHSLGAPRVKLLRVLAKLLEEYPDEPISDVSIQASASCSGFSGVLTFGPKATKIEFNWDCAWKAAQEGLQTWYGEPDQAKAAQLFGYQCFEQFEKVD